MNTCKVISVKSIGKEKTYNLTMKSGQHNYKIINNEIGIYSRNSHSCAYSFIAYQGAYLKLYYPIEYMCQLLTCELGNEEKLDEYIREATKMGIVIMKTDINKSGTEFKIEKGINRNGDEYEFLRAPFTALKGIGDKSVEEIIKNQPYPTLKDYIKKMEGKTAKNKVFEVLVDAGAMDESWGMSREQIKSNYEKIKSELKREKKELDRNKEKIQVMKDMFGEGSLFDKISESEEEIKI